MHELPFAKSIYKSVMEQAEKNNALSVTRVSLEVGMLRDFIPDLVQRYWRYVAQGSIAENATIEMKEIPATAQCRDCGTVYPFHMQDLRDCHCPKCGCDTGKIVTGRELRILTIEIV